MSRFFQCIRTIAGSVLLLAGGSAGAINVLNNPNFNIGTPGWTADASVTVAFSTNDANASPTSGSASVTNSRAGASDGAGMQQCIGGVTTGSSYTYGGKIFYPSGQARTGPVVIGFRWMTGAGCTGSQMGGSPPDLSLNSPNDAWATYTGGTVTVPAGAVSAVFIAYTSKVEAGGSLQGLFDDLYVDNGFVASTITKSFGAASIPFNGSTSLTLSIANPNASALSGVAVSDTLPAGLVVATPNGLTNSCGGSVTAVAGSGSVSLTAGTIAGSASCAVTVNVTGTSAGLKINTTSTVSSTEGGIGGTATASITVAQAVAATSIPTLGEWGLMLLSALMAGAAFLGLRRRAV